VLVLVLRAGRDELIGFKEGTEALFEQRLKLLIELEVQRQRGDLRSEALGQKVLLRVAVSIQFVFLGILYLDQELPYFDEHILKDSLLSCLVYFLQESSFFIE